MFGYWLIVSLQSTRNCVVWPFEKWSKTEVHQVGRKLNPIVSFISIVSMPVPHSPFESLEGLMKRLHSHSRI